MNGVRGRSGMCIKQHGEVLQGQFEHTDSKAKNVVQSRHIFAGQLIAYHTKKPRSKFTKTALHGSSA